MIIRQHVKEDLPQIIALLKQSIGEALTPKTEAYFLWKHEKNSFGKSKILLAVEADKIIGLRAFMRWNWISGEESVKAVRAVDTATDPAFQGKGIFKKLTMQVVEECRQEGIEMVFNSPNAISMKGYLKMGWSLEGKLPVYIKPGNLLARAYSTEIVNGFYNEYSIEDSLKKLNEKWSLPSLGKILHTPVEFNYLNWRYTQCPVAKYGAMIVPGQYGIVFRIKKMNRFMELRICEVWTETDFDSGKLAREAFKKIVNKIRPAIVSCAPSPLFLSGKKQIANFFGPFKKGPFITIRSLTKESLGHFQKFNRWQPSLGTMELF